MYGPKLHINHADHILFISNLFSLHNWGVRTAHESLSSFGRRGAVATGIGVFEWQLRIFTETNVGVWGLCARVRATTESSNLRIIVTETVIWPMNG